MIRCKTYWMTRDANGTRCVWTHKKGLTFEPDFDNTWDGYEGTFLEFDEADPDNCNLVGSHEEWKSLLGSKCFGIKRGGAGPFVVCME